MIEYKIKYLKEIYGGSSIMAKIKIYTTEHCPYCIAAKKLCESKGLEYQEIDLTHDFEGLAKIKEKTGMQTVPQIFVNEEFIGGYTEFRQLNNSGELDKKL
jgi:glutaredoxin 3